MEERLVSPMVYAFKMKVVPLPPSPGFPHGTPIMGIDLLKEDVESELIFSKQSDSFVGNMTDFLYKKLSAAASISSTDYLGAGHSIGYPMRMNSSQGYYQWGIVVGTGSTPVAIGNYQLGTLILHGSTSGTLWNDVTNIALLVSSSSRQLVAVTKAFWNISGGTITVNEMGTQIYDGSFYYLTQRDIVSVVMNNGDLVTFAYLLDIT